MGIHSIWNITQILCKYYKSHHRGLDCGLSVMSLASSKQERAIKSFCGKHQQYCWYSVDTQQGWFWEAWVTPSCSWYFSLWNHNMKKTPLSASKFCLRIRGDELGSFMTFFQIVGLCGFMICCETSKWLQLYLRGRKQGKSLWRQRVVHLVIFGSLKHAC